MGLSASQARLLTITSRKSDCEFQSMRLSHEKIALSRSMTDISNEYQNSLDQTKLVYDFYGTNDRSTDVSYALFMQPSELNGYMPILTTDATGKVVLDGKYAAAARAAGIPTEGLGSLPSDVIRNRFLDSLASTGIITQTACENYKAITYSQSSGIGDTAAVTAITQEMSFAEMLENVFTDKEISLTYGINNGSNPGYADDDSLRILIGASATENPTVSLADVLLGEEKYTLMYKALSGSKNEDDRKNHVYEYNGQQVQFKGLQAMSNWWLQEGAGRDMLDALRDALTTSDPRSRTAIAYADAMINDILNANQVLPGGLKTSAPYNKGEAVASNMGGAADRFAYDTNMSAAGTSKDNNREAARMFVSDINVVRNAKDYIGYYSRTTRMNTERGSDDSAKAQYETLSINISNVLKAYLTYFADAMSNFESDYYVDPTSCTMTLAAGSDHRVVSASDARTVSESKLVGSAPRGNGDSLDFKFNVVTSKEVNTSDALMSSFYDALFNQICLRGWVENNAVNNKDYLQDMFKNGMMFVTATADDGYYYQKNYGSYSYIKEVADEDAIARAEAKYNTEKAKLNHKEEMLDLKMKNLDTEINSLTTEYDTIKSLITKNIERGFKRYEA